MVTGQLSGDVVLDVLAAADGAALFLPDSCKSQAGATVTLAPPQQTQTRPLPQDTRRQSSRPHGVSSEATFLASTLASWNL